MKNCKPIGKITFLLLLLLLLSGCFDKRESEEQAYVIAIGMDKAEEEGLVKISYIIANPEAGSTVEGGSTNEPPREIISFVSNDFISSRDLGNTVIAKEITYDILQLIIVSEDFARDEDFIRWIYDATKSMEIRRDTKLLITKEDTTTFLQINQPSLETRPHRYFNLIFQRGEETGMIPPSDLNSFFRITEADADLFLGMYGTTERSEKTGEKSNLDQIVAGEFHYGGETNPTQFVGSALFKEGKMIDTLTSEETRLAYFLNPTLRIQEVTTTVPDPFNETYRIATRITPNGEVDIRMNLKKGPPEIHVTLPLLVELLSNHSMTEYKFSKKNQDILKHEVEKYIENEITKLIRKTQEEYGSEPFGWSIIARKKFLTIPEWRAFDWMKTYPDMKINISVKVKLGKFGRQADLPRIEEVRD